MLCITFPNPDFKTDENFVFDDEFYDKMVNVTYSLKDCYLHRMKYIKTEETL